MGHVQKHVGSLRGEDTIEMSSHGCRLTHYSTIYLEQLSHSPDYHGFTYNAGIITRLPVPIGDRHTRAQQFDIHFQNQRDRQNMGQGYPN